MKRAASEADLAREVVGWLRRDAWDVWTEVQPTRGGKVCDIVARRGPVTHAIECKNVANLAVVSQATNWIGRAHWVSVAVPTRTFCRLYAQMANAVGVGVLYVQMPNPAQYRPLVEVDARLAPMLRACEHRYARPLSDYCTPEVAKWAAEPGNNTSDRYTPFRAFCATVRQLVEAEPGITIKECVGRIKEHHYSSDKTARSSLYSWVLAGKVPGVRIGDSASERACGLHPTTGGTP